MKDRIANFTESPLTAFGTAAGPWTEHRRPGPMWAMFGGGPSKSIKPVHRIERHLPDVRVRMWFASMTGIVWMSPGYHSIRFDRYVVLKARSWWRRRFPTSTPPDWPTAEIVKR